MDKRKGPTLPYAVILKPLVFNLEEGLQLEYNYRPNLLMVFQNIHNPGETTLDSRDAAVKMLRFLRAWFDVPYSVFFSAVSYLDMFLVKMKVQEKFLRCLTLSCLYLAMESESCKIHVDQLVNITESKCTSRDVVRMANIVKDKLRNAAFEKPTTAADFLKIYIEILECVSQKWDHFISRDLNQIKEKMLILLEVLLSDSYTAFCRPSSLAMIIFQSEVENIMAQGLPSKSKYYLGEVLQFLAIIREIQLKCKIKNAELKVYYAKVSKIIKKYDGQEKNTCVQKLNLSLSFSTMQMSMKHSNYKPLFETIYE